MKIKTVDPAVTELRITLTITEAMQLKDVMRVLRNARPAGLHWLYADQFITGITSALFSLDTFGQRGPRVVNVPLNFNWVKSQATTTESQATA